MLCPKCGYFSEREENVCPECGEVIAFSDGSPAGGSAEMIRQGKRAREAIRTAAARSHARTAEGEKSAETARKRHSGASRATVEMPAVQDSREQEGETVYPVSESDEGDGEGGEAEPSFERRRRTVYDENAALEEQAEAYSVRAEQSRRTRLRKVNWIRVGIAAFAAVVLLLAGGWLFLTRTEDGQKIMARMGRDATSAAYWSVGEERMNTGDMDGAIADFEKAKKQDEEAELVDVDGLLMLASAYEAAGRIQDAADLYEQIYTETPSRTEAYVNHIRILQSTGKDEDKAKAAELMKLAYSKTGEDSFQTQRRDLIPAPPEVDLTAGFYESKKYIAITSYQGYDVYYTFDENAELPAGGTKFTERVFLDEGIHALRAVAVNGALVSDELRGTYKIIMPSPQTPQCNLAPGAYKTRQRVRLKPGKDNLNDDDIVIYYTVDGSNPDADCPIYTGEPVLLPSGHTVTIKAVAVNKYNKVSNMLEVKYKIEAKPYPLTAWDLTENIAALELNRSTMLDFQSAYGEGTMTELESYEGFETPCRRLDYGWGYAVMTMSRKSWVLVELYFTTPETFKAPRKTGVGDPGEYVIGQFKDLGQLASASGNRGLYALDNGSDGKIWLQEDGTEIIRYRIRSEGHWYQLEYHTDNSGTVASVDWKYIP